jgi:hypothetical protein
MVHPAGWAGICPACVVSGFLGSVARMMGNSGFRLAVRGNGSSLVLAV